MDMLNIVGRYFDPLPILAPPTTCPQLFAKDLFPLTFDAGHQHRPHLGFWYRRHLSWKTWCGISGGVLGESQNPRRCSAGSNQGGWRTSDLVSLAPLGSGGC
jgi:hypothetical protein